MPFTILVIDDDPMIRQVLTDVLATKGHQVLVAADGEEGLARAHAERRPDLILLDYHMPGLDGPGVLDRLKGDPATRRIPVVALTSGTAADANVLSRAGAIGFIPKPFVSEELLRLVNEILSATVGRARQTGA